ncbi:MAG: sensor histidine kinase [Geminicoccales bacterium]
MGVGIADEKQLEHIFANLLSNAVKYSPEKKSCIMRCRFEGNHVALTVSDSGVGIPESELPQLIQRFFRASTLTGIAGTGIGLNIFNRLVEMHNSENSVRSTPS